MTVRLFPSLTQSQARCTFVRYGQAARPCSPSAAPIGLELAAATSPHSSQLSLPTLSATHRPLPTPLHSPFVRLERTKPTNTISKLLLYLVWTAVVAALSSLNPDYSVASIASSHPASTSFGGPVGSVALQKRTNAVNQTCDARTVSWFAMVAAYAFIDQVSLTNQLNATFAESGMVIGELPKLASSYYDVDRVWCDFFPEPLTRWELPFRDVFWKLPSTTFALFHTIHG